MRRFFVLVVAALLASAAAPVSADTVADGAHAAVPTIDLGRYRGDVVVLEFMATWCGACKSAIPTVNGWQETYGSRGLRVVNVSKEDADLLERYKGEAGIATDVAQDENGELSDRFGVRALPTFVVLDKDGAEVERVVGAGPNLAKVEATFKRLLGDSGPLDPGSPSF